MLIYVKSTSNCPEGLELQKFEILSSAWEGKELSLRFNDGIERIVVGWTDLFGGAPCDVHVARVRHESGREGILIWGGNSGLRVLDRSVHPTPGLDDHLPPGRGMPIIWVKNENDLPEEVRQVISKPQSPNHSNERARMI